jgi:hypothetical protein
MASEFYHLYKDLFNEGPGPGSMLERPPIGNSKKLGLPPSFGKKTSPFANFSF